MLARSRLALPGWVFGLPVRGIQAAPERRPMIFIAASNEPTMMILLTDQDVADMRGGRTKFVDQRATKGFKFDKVVISVHKNQAEIEDIIRRAGHGPLLQNMPSHEPKPPEGQCEGCNGIMPEPLLLEKKCVACWRESAEQYRKMWLEEVGENPS